MHSRRRLIALAAVSTLAVIGLSACRSAPTVAAYVGDTKITEDQVTAIVNEALPKSVAIREQGQAAGQQVRGEPGPTRDTVVQTLVINELCDTLTKAQGVTRKEVGAQDIATLESVAADTEYAKQRAAMFGCLLAVKADPVAPTEEQLNDLFQWVSRAGLVRPGTKASDIAPVFQQAQVKASLGVAKLITDEAAKQNVSVNPRYRSLPVPVLVADSSGNPIEVQSAVPSLGQPASNAVTDRL